MRRLGAARFCDALMISANSVTLGSPVLLRFSYRCALVRGLGAAAGVALDYALKQHKHGRLDWRSGCFSEKVPSSSIWCSSRGARGVMPMPRLPVFWLFVNFVVPRWEPGGWGDMLGLRALSPGRPRV